MSGHVAFEGRIVPLRWGRSIYTILPLPPEVAAALGPATRVEGEIGEHPVNLGVARADPAVREGPFLWTGKAFPKAVGIAPGERLEVRLRPADPDRVELPEDVTAALCAAGRMGDWDALTPGRRRGLLAPVARAVRPATRAARIARLVAAL
ncbi:MAG: YdeI/OmpD-associated family protein [Hasllibacter sp.]